MLGVVGLQSSARPDLGLVNKRLKFMKFLGVKSTKSHGISPTASRWNRSHSKIDIRIGPKFFFAEGGLSPTFWDLFHQNFSRCGKVPEYKNSVE